MLVKHSCRRNSKRNAAAGATLAEVAITLPVVLLIITSVIDLYRIAEAYLAAVSMADTAVANLSVAEPSSPVPAALTALVQPLAGESGSVSSRRANAWSSLLASQNLANFSRAERQSLNAAYGQLVSVVGGRSRVAFPIPSSYHASELGMVPNVTLSIEPEGETVVSTTPAGDYRARSVRVNVALNTITGWMANYQIPPVTFQVRRHVPRTVRVGEPAMVGSIGVGIRRGKNLVFQGEASFGG